MSLPSGPVWSHAPFAIWGLIRFLIILTLTFVSVFGIRLRSAIEYLGVKNPEVQRPLNYTYTFQLWTCSVFSKGDKRAPFERSLFSFDSCAPLALTCFLWLPSSMNWSPKQQGVRAGKHGTHGVGWSGSTNQPSGPLKLGREQSARLMKSARLSPLLILDYTYPVTQNYYLRKFTPRKIFGGKIANYTHHFLK